MSIDLKDDVKRMSSVQHLSKPILPTNISAGPKNIEDFELVIGCTNEDQTP